MFLKSKIFCLMFAICSAMASFAEDQTPIFFIQKLKRTELVGILGQAPEDGAIPGYHGIYAFQSANFPPRTRYTLYAQGLGQRKRKLLNCIANDEGILQYRKEKQYYPLSLALQGLGNFMPGEPIEFILTSHKIELKTKVIPNSLEAIDYEGRKVSMEIVTPDCSFYGIELTNFKPNEEITITSKSGAEVMRHNITVSKLGTMNGGMHPAVIGQKKGVATLEIHPVTSENVLTIHYEWGPLYGSK